VFALAIGLPINMDGSEGPRAQASRAFARNLEKLTEMPLLFWDERLSTVAAERTLIEMDFSRKARQTKIDSAAAAFILQGVLDRLHVLR
jgi:putative Holliday junction resolvase